MNLYDIRAQRKYIDVLKERIQLHRLAMEIGERQLRLAPSAPSAHDKLAADMAKLDAMERELVALVARFEQAVLEMETQLGGRLRRLPEQQQLIVRLRDVEGYQWADVSKRSGYSASHCRFIYRKAKKLITYNHPKSDKLVP